MSEEMQTINTDIFKNGLLISYSIGFWDGKKKQDDMDVQTQNADVAREVYERGNKLLLPQGSLKEFYGFRARLGLTLSRYSFAVPGLRGCRFVPKNVYPKLKEFLTKEAKAFHECAEEFLGKYEEYKEAQISAFNARYPTHSGQLDDAYPDIETVRGRFSYFWMPYAWDYAAIAEIENSAKSALEEMSEAIIANSCVSMRIEIQEEILNVLNSLKKSKNKVGARAVAGLVEKIESLKSINVFGDKKLDDILNQASETVRSVASWKKVDVEKTDFELQLKRLFHSVADEIKEVIEDPLSELEYVRSINPTEETISDTVDDLQIQRGQRTVTD
jgi:hypothetical protein